MYVAQLREDGAVLGVQRINKPTAAPPWYEISEETASTIRDAGLRQEGADTPQWSYDPATGTLTPLVDARILATWSRASVNAVVGGPPVVVRLTLSDLTVNGSQLLEFEDVHPMRVTFVDGVADVAVSTDAPMRVQLRRCKTFRLASPLAVQVLDNRIRPRA